VQPSDIERYSSRAGLDRAERPLQRGRYAGEASDAYVARSAEQALNATGGQQTTATNAQRQTSRPTPVQRLTRAFERLLPNSERARPDGEPDSRDMDVSAGAQGDVETTASIEDTYQAQGIELGGFQLFPVLDLRAGFQEVSDDTSGYGALSAALTGRGTVGDVAIALSATANLDNTDDSFSNANVAASLNGSYDLNSHISVGASASYALTPQDGQFISTTNPNILSNLPDEQVFGLGASATLTGNRLSLTPSIAVEDHSFSGGAVASNLDYLQTEVSARLAYQATERTSGFVEGGVRNTEFDRTIGSDSLRRGSETRSLAAGLTYAPGSWLSAEVSVGYQEADYEDGSSLSGNTLAAAINWQASDFSALNLAASYGLEDDVLTAGGVERGQASLELVHRFREYLEASVGLGMLYEAGPSQKAEARLNSNAELAYAFRRGVFVTAGGNVSRVTQGVNSGAMDWQVYTGVRLAR
jgi:hypothetical protein